MAEKSSEIDNAKASKLKIVAASRSGRGDRVDPGRGTTDPYPPINHFKSAQWSADGTCVITNSADNQIRTFVIPPELLDQRDEPLQLEPYCMIASHDPTDAVVAYPSFKLQDPPTALVLSAVNEYPIRLNSALTSDLVASYPLTRPSTEVYIKPNCLAFAQHGSHFIAGSDSLISTFDVSRPGQEPLLSSRTGPKKNKATEDDLGKSMRGIVSALAIDQQHNILAAGTLTRHVGLYDAGGLGECLGVFEVRGTKADERIGGRGITQVLWSSCGRYLYLAERRSHGIMMYDIRRTGQMLGWLEGRNADTNQRMQVDLLSADAGEEQEIWAGGTDGLVRVWRNPQNQEEAILHSIEYPVHDDAVSSAVLHPSGTVLATVSGQRHFTDGVEPESDDLSLIDHVSLKVWSVEARPSRP